LPMLEYPVMAKPRNKKNIGGAGKEGGQLADIDSLSSQKRELLLSRKKKSKGKRMTNPGFERGTEKRETLHRVKKREESLSKNSYSTRCGCKLYKVFLPRGPAPLGKKLLFHGLNYEKKGGRNALQE